MSDIPRYTKIGKCIYCGTEQGKLTNEHIVPLGLGGTVVLKSASCLACAKITSQFERDILRGPFLNPRLAVGMPTRHKKTRPTQIRYADLFNKHGERVAVENDSSLLLLSIIEFPLPAFVDKRGYKNGADVIAVRTIKVAGPDIKDLQQSGITSIEYPETYVATSFARFIAKIAHGFAVAFYGLDSFEELFLPSSILGTTGDICRWVGCLTPPVLGRIKEVHHISLYQDHSVVIAHIKLFACWETPEYLVVVGRLNEDYHYPPDLEIKSDHVSSQIIIDPDYHEEPGTTLFGECADPDLEIAFNSRTHYEWLTQRSASNNHESGK
ncbi:HNH endonuclease [Methanosphaerula subterraneus]|uniref:HNH endonuclease n=1 Tax=Methanosphaerula subterraneus TaxID=3350244 RepID=UPI003F87D88C